MNVQTRQLHLLFVLLHFMFFWLLDWFCHFIGGSKRSQTFFTNFDADQIQVSFTFGQSWIPNFWWSFKRNISLKKGINKEHRAMQKCTTETLYWFRSDTETETQIGQYLNQKVVETSLAIFKLQHRIFLVMFSYIKTYNFDPFYNVIKSVYTEKKT